MEKSLTQNEFLQLMRKLAANELFKKSKSLHKYLQFKRFNDVNPEKLMNGQYIRREDIFLNTEDSDMFDVKTAKVVIYNFKDGFLHSENDEPAIQYPGHWEYWEKGLIKKVVADGGDTEEYWEDGVPVRIETNLAERRRQEVENGK